MQLHRISGIPPRISQLGREMPIRLRIRARIPGGKSFFPSSAEQRMIRRDEAHLRSGDEIACDHGTAKLYSVQSPQIVSIDQAARYFEDRRVHWLLNQAPDLSSNRGKQNGGFVRNKSSFFS